MEITISESVKKQLIKESMLDDFRKTLSKIASIGEKSIEESNKIRNFDIKFLLTWSSTIGGFMGPLSDFIAGQEHNLTKAEVMFIALGVTASLFYNNEKLVSKILSRVSELGLMESFKMALEKGKELKGAFISFLESIGITTSNILHIASFTFLIPLLGIFMGIAQNSTITHDEIVEIVERIIASGVTRHSSVILKNAIKNLVSKTKENPGNEESQS